MIILTMDVLADSWAEEVMLRHSWSTHHFVQGTHEPLLRVVAHLLVHALGAEGVGTVGEHHWLVGLHVVEVLAQGALGDVHYCSN